MSMPTAGRQMEADIAAQPAVLARLLDEGSDAIAEVRHRITVADPGFVVIAGRGTSDHAAVYAKYLAEVELGLPAGLGSLSTTTVYAAPQRLTGGLYLAVSQSGESPDLVAATTAARKAGAITVAVTNAPQSALTQVAEFGVDIRAGQESSVAATKTYTAELLALYLLLVGAGAEAVPEAAARLSRPSERVAGLAELLRGADRVVLTGRGYSYASALEAGLKLMETCYVTAHAFSGADLLHGPVAMVDESVPVVAFSSPGPAGDALVPVLDRVAATGAPLIRIGTGADLDVPELPDRLRPIVEIMPAQHLVLAVARLRGTDPDLPRGLSKITRTW